MSDTYKCDDCSETFDSQKALNGHQNAHTGESSSSPSLPTDWNPSAPTEASSDYNGAFSWGGESHAFTAGVGVGVTGEKSLMVAFAGYAIGGAKSEFAVTNDAHIRQVVKEPAYALGGMVLGYAANLAALGKPIHEFLPMLLSLLGVA